MAGHENRKSVGLDDAETMDNFARKMKFEENAKYRLGFPLLNENGKVNLVCVHYYKFNETLKKSFIVPDNAELAKAAAKVMGDPIFRYVTVAVKYATNAKGELLKPLTWTVEPIVVDNKRLADLKQINGEFPIAECDIVVTCTDKKFQTLSIAPTKQALWRNDKIMKQIQEEAEEVAKIMHTAVSSEFSEDQIRNIVGMDSNSSGSPHPADDSPNSGTSIDPDKVDVDDLLAD